MTQVMTNLLREMVDLVGIEPTTSSMPWKRAPSCATGPFDDKKVLFNFDNFHPLERDSQTCVIARC
jgi:hypothetical protein